jgi:hypothetical protein
LGRQLSLAGGAIDPYPAQLNTIEIEAKEAFALAGSHPEGDMQIGRRPQDQTGT